LGIIIPTDFHIFQWGWNHQPEMLQVEYCLYKKTMLDIGPCQYPTMDFNIFQHFFFPVICWDMHSDFKLFEWISMKPGYSLISSYLKIFKYLVIQRLISTDSHGFHISRPLWTSRNSSPQVLATPERFGAMEDCWWRWWIPNMGKMITCVSFNEENFWESKIF
jgi:hypothetical protein